MENPPIILTMGEPAGIGPELIIKVKKILGDRYPFYVIGDFNFLTSIATKSSIETVKIQHYSQTFKYPEKLCIFDHKLPDKVVPGNISLKNSAVVKQNIQKAVSLVKTKQALALVTNPINKWALKQNKNFLYEGHTDFLAYLDSENATSVMMLANRNGFRVIPVTVHIPIKQISSKLTPQLLKKTLNIVANSLRTDYEIENPKILITGMNPHAGENSTIGLEESTVIAPVIKNLQHPNFQLIGPVPADTAFTPKNRSKYDAFVCMYHDQALIPIKTISFHESINITLGLSFVRTSPDHGTALDISGKNEANPQSLILAIEEAQNIAKARQKYAEKK
ncbi:MAG: 4-hydroxythreonine-4-phosphate dehydrogenase PdxA [Paracoccaceae bacterium]|nr:4-hydroxythreonine-4-phosphate dehydrogenase PdxA [Paracoccaceae bacterium]